MVCSFSHIYKPLFMQQGRYFDLVGGRGRGGSYTGTLYFLHMITQPGYFRGCFLRQTLGDVRESLYREFKDRVNEIEDTNGSVKYDDFDFNDTVMTITYRPTGNIIISKGVTKSSGRTAKLKSLAGITHVLIEEADELGREDFDQLDLSLRTIKGKIKIIRIFNPPHKSHWIWDQYNLTEATERDYAIYGIKPPKDGYYFKFTPKTTSNVVCMFSTYFDNSKNLDNSFKEKLESYRKNNLDYYYTIILGFVSEGMKGRVFSGWKPITNQAFNEIDAKSIFGLDFGLASAAGLVEIKFVKNDMYIRELNYDPATNLEIAIKLCELGIKQQIIIADSAEPISIAKLRRGWTKDELAASNFVVDENGQLKARYQQLIDGFYIYPAAKGPGSIKSGISLLKDYTIHVTEDSTNLWKEYIEYKWALDKNKDPTDEPIDQWNHLIDPSRYVAQLRSKHY